MVMSASLVMVNGRFFTNTLLFSSPVPYCNEKQNNLLNIRLRMNK